MPRRGAFSVLRGSGIKWWDGDIWVTSFATGVAAGVGLYLISAIGGYAENQWQSHVVRGAMGWALAYCAVGFFAGFLFGIPRVLQDDGAPAAGGTANGTNGTTSRAYEQRVNTNLEQISDWLTKIIVGLGLVELRAIPDHLYKGADWMGRALGLRADDQSVASFSCAFIIYFSIVGFLAGYLITRLFLAGAFWRADRRQVVSTSTFSRLPDAIRIRNFWKPGGRVDRTRQSAMDAWLKTNGISAMLPQFIAGANFSAAQARMITALNIP